MDNNINNRLIRHKSLIPCKTAFIDAKTPGSDKKQNFCIIGSGVTENSEQIVHIEIPHPFNIGAAKQPNGCKNSHHSHDTAEVFFVHKGRWQFTWGEYGNEGSVTLEKGATYSIPTHLFRGFENVGCDDGFLLSILGLGVDGTPGKVVWAPYVHNNAKQHGLVLLKNGGLIDTQAGEKIPQNAEIEQPPTKALIDSFKKYTVEAMLQCIQTQEEAEITANSISENSGLNKFAGITEIPTIGVVNAKENMPEAKIGWEHDFQVRRLRLQANSSIPKHIRKEEEVIFVHKGTIKVTIDNHDLTLNTGDTLTVPINSSRQYSNFSDESSEAIIVRGATKPEPAIF